MTVGRRQTFGDGHNSVGRRDRREKPMLHRATPERMTLFSDGIFAVLITVLVLDLRPPVHPTFEAVLALWPAWLSYAISYLFIAIVWINHHYLLRYAAEATPRLVWFNFAHLFSMSLLPFSTAWMALSGLAPQAVSFYAAVFFVVNATYVCLIHELVERTPDVPSAVRKAMRRRAIVTLFLFASASLTALRYPLAGLGICLCCLAVYLRPDPPSSSPEPKRNH